MRTKKRRKFRKASRSRPDVLQRAREWIDEFTRHLARAPRFRVDAEDLAALPHAERIVVERARHAAVYIRDLVREVLLVFERSAAALGRRTSPRGRRRGQLARPRAPGRSQRSDRRRRASAS